MSENSTEVQSTTIELLVLQPGQEPREVSVERGTTVAQLAATLGIDGAESMAAMDSLSNTLGPDTVIGPDTETLSFIYKLAGA